MRQETPNSFNIQRMEKFLHNLYLRLVHLDSFSSYCVPQNYTISYHKMTFFFQFKMRLVLVHLFRTASSWNKH